MMKFETPEIEVVKFSVVDVLTASSAVETTEEIFVPGDDELPIG